MNILSSQEKIKDNLDKQILEPWLRLVDTQQGVFHAAADRMWNIDDSQELSCVLVARSLWTYSRAYRLDKNDRWLKAAQLAYKTLSDYFHDKEQGGYYWSVAVEGSIIDGRKHIYAQSFTLYGLSEYMRINKDSALEQEASDLFSLLMEKGWDRQFGGFIECRGKNWEELEDQRLSPRDRNVDKSMNTNLHAMEALSNYYDLCSEERVKSALKETVDMVIQRIINRENGHFHLFFNMDWSVEGDVVSYGHDIEGVWLIREALEKLPDYEGYKELIDLLVHMGEITLKEGIDPLDGACLYEGLESGPNLLNKDWWPQAEAMVGFLDLYMISGQENFLKAADRLWNFIEQKMVDKEYGGWFWSTDEKGRPMKLEKAGPWQCPYHNSRGCWEALDRIAIINQRRK